MEKQTLKNRINSILENHSGSDVKEILGSVSINSLLKEHLLSSRHIIDKAKK